MTTRKNAFSKSSGSRLGLAHVESKFGAKGLIKLLDGAAETGAG